MFIPSNKENRFIKFPLYQYMYFGNIFLYSWELKNFARILYENQFSSKTKKKNMQGKKIFNFSV